MLDTDQAERQGEAGAQNGGRSARPPERGRLAFPITQATSWGRVARAAQPVARPRFMADVIGWAQGARAPRLAVGLRRSYGDTVLSREAQILDMSGLDRLMAFDPATGVLRAEAGLSFDALMRVLAPRGFFPATCPGTRHVTLGGAIANDVHGKNHHRAGTFGCSVLGFTLLRSDRGLVEVTAEREPDLFAATIGGLGLTGIILDATIRLTPIGSTALDVETLPFANLDGFFALAEESEAAFEHTVAWVDCTASGAKLGRGIFQRANWRDDGVLSAHRRPSPARLPFDAPGFALNRFTLRAFNALYHADNSEKKGAAMQHYERFFHPLDAIADWNKLYGPNGFYQYQCVVPKSQRSALADMLAIVARSGQGSFLAVLKSFGDRASPGLLSFPMPGYTLALDFANRGDATLRLLADLDSVARAANGRLYPAKDGRMPKEMFEAGYPNLDAFKRHIDPLCISDFWARVA